MTATGLRSRSFVCAMQLSGENNPFSLSGTWAVVPSYLAHHHDAYTGPLGRLDRCAPPLLPSQRKPLTGLDKGELVAVQSALPCLLHLSLNEF